MCYFWCRRDGKIIYFPLKFVILEGSICWNMIEKIIIEDIEEERLLIKIFFNHCFVIDVRPAIC